LSLKKSNQTDRKSIIKIAIYILFITGIIFAGCENKKNENVTQNSSGQNQYNNSPQVQKPEIKKLADIDKKTEEEIIGVIRRNLKASQEEDKEGVLSTVHSQSPQRKSTINGMAYVFQNYDLTYTLEKAEVIEVNGDEAKVYYVQTTEGKDFPRNTSEGIHTLKKENGKWKIFRTDPIQ